MIKTHQVYYPLYNDKEKFIILITGGRASGKCLKKGTKVMMSDLTIKRIEDIRVGEFVMGDDGAPRQVITRNKGYGDLYTIKQEYGEDYTVNEHHILTLMTKHHFRDEKKRTKREIRDVPISKLPKDARISNYYGVHCDRIEYKEQELPIEPYMLGLWLSHADSNFPHAQKKPIVDYLNGYDDEKSKSFTLDLLSLDLAKKLHIPHIYIANSSKSRLELLAAFIDANGLYNSQRGRFTIIERNKELAEQIKFLCITLGFKTTLSFSKDNKVKHCKYWWYYQIDIEGKVGDIPTRIFDVEGKWGSKGHHKYSHIKVKKEKKGEWYGIMINGNQRFLLADGTITHNSFSAGTFIERLTFETGTDEQGNLIPHNILFTRYTMVSAQISVIPEFREKIELDGTERYFSTTKTDVVNRATGARVMFRGIHTSSGNQTAKLKSIHGITTLVVDEAEEWVSEQEFDTIMLSIRKKGIQNRIVIIMNPTDSNHFIYQRYIKDTHKIVEFDGVPVQISTHPNVLHIHTSYLDNIEHCGEEFLREVEEMKVKNPEKYAHIVMGRWSDVAEGAIFKKYGFVDEFPKEAKAVALGVDWGYVCDPTAMVKCGIVDNRLYMEEMDYRTALTNSELIHRFREIGLHVYADSADPRLINEIALGGVVIYGAQKGGGSIIAGIEKMHDMELFIVRGKSGSPNLHNEFRNYTWDKDANGNYINEPIDAYNHCCFTKDTLVNTKRGKVRISEVTDKDYVINSDGWHKVVRRWDNGIKEVIDYVICVQKGGKIKHDVKVSATRDHKVKTKEGWCRIDNLKQDDYVYLLEPQCVGWARVIKVTRRNAREELVYNLEVEDVHEYFANGLLVSNCDAVRYYVNGRLLGKIVQPRKQLNKSQLGIF